MDNDFKCFDSESKDTVDVAVGLLIMACSWYDAHQQVAFEAL